MKEREHITREITELADRIKANAAHPEALLTDVTHLYEMAVLLKHLPENGTPAGSMPSAETMEDKSKETQQIEMDLFSTETSPASFRATEEMPSSSGSKQAALETRTSEKIQQGRVSDLKTYIGINDKFRFINELFDGNIKEYNVAIDQINSFAQPEEALSYIHNLESVYKWQPENTIAENFRELVQRKFSA